MGPLAGIKVIEMAGIGPAPFCGMLLADMGADVVRIDRTEPIDLGIATAPRFDVFNRNKRSVALDLKSPHGVETARRLIDRADILIEGFRPGVMEKLGLGPEACSARNQRLVYGRMTGWGQDGPLAARAGHDLNYIAMAGALHGIGPSDGPPQPPLNLVADLGGGALYLAMGVLAAVIEARSSGRGQVVDAAMVDGVASLMTMFTALRQSGDWTLSRSDNLLDGGAPFYAVYETRDGRWVSVAAIERRFYGILIERLGLAGESLPDQYDRAQWPLLRARFAATIATRDRDAWCSIMDGCDACFAPVLDLDEARGHALAASRAMYLKIDGVTQPRPAPRFSRTDGAVRHGAPEPGADTAAALAAWKITPPG